MPRYIIKLSKESVDYYMEWSTVVDAPVTYGMSLDEFKEYYKTEYGESGFRDNFEDRMKRVEEKGTSSMMDSNVKELISYNRAGKDETCLSENEIIQKYCIERE